jgi:hypothetical protein
MQFFDLYSPTSFFDIIFKLTILQSEVEMAGLDVKALMKVHLRMLDL